VVSQNVFADEDDLQAPNAQTNVMAMAGRNSILIIIGLTATKIIIAIFQPQNSFALYIPTDEVVPLLHEYDRTR